MSKTKSIELPFYVYILAKPDGTPFYVGKGCGKRIYAHERIARLTNAKSRKLSTIRKIWRAGGEVVRVFDSRHATSEAAAKREIELIADIGRIDLGTGPLTNLTDGGDGFDGLPSELVALRHSRSATTRRTAEARAKNAQRQRARIEADPAIAAELASRVVEGAKKWRQQFPLFAAAHVAKAIAAARTDEAKAKAAASLRIYYRRHPEKLAEKLASLNAPEAARKRIERSTATNRRPEVIAKGLATRLRWREANPEVEAARVSKLVEFARSDANRQRVSEQMRQRWTSPEARERFKEKMRQKWADPAYKAAVAAKISATRRKKANYGTQIHLFS